MATPALAKRYTKLLSRLQQWTPSSPSDPLTASHAALLSDASSLPATDAVADSDVERVEEWLKRVEQFSRQVQIAQGRGREDTPDSHHAGGGGGGKDKAAAAEEKKAKAAAKPAAQSQPQPKKEKAQPQKDRADESKDAAKAALPEYIAHRIAVWDRVAAASAAAASQSSTGSPITVTLPDGKTLPGTAGVTTPSDIARQLTNSTDRFVVARVDSELWDLHRPLAASCSLSLLDFDSKEGQHAFWHSSAHILGQAVEAEYGEVRLCVGPPLEDGGFYYDVEMGEQKVSPADFPKLEKAAEKITRERQPFTRLVLSKEQALDMFRFNPFKQEIIRSKVPDGANCTAYRCGNLVDLCKGPHLPNTGVVKALAVTKASSAYWLAKAENASLQRVYGISFPNKQRLKEWEEFQRRAEERDHRRVGLQQKLFFFHEWSPGSCFFLPHGARVYNKLVSFIRDEYSRRGYSEVISPNLFNVELWKRSGHYDNYKENMFILQAEGVDFGIKPMNCPGHCLMFASTLHSYRELPIRLADFGVLHRNEISGALTGLTRVRRFQQDDAHIFCIAAGTEVSVSSGVSVPIEQVAAGMEVFGLADSGQALQARAVSATFDRGVRDCIELLFEDGRTLTCTPDHRILTQDGSWVPAGQLVVGKSLVCAGPEFAVSDHSLDSRPTDASWTVNLRASLGFALSVRSCADRAKAQAFARLMGLLLTDRRGGAAYGFACVLGHQLDVAAVQRDLALLGLRPAVVRLATAFELLLPSALAEAAVAIGIVPGRNIASLTHLPPDFVSPLCPLTVVREFLGGLFGGDGCAPFLADAAASYVSVGFEASKKGLCAWQQMNLMKLELVPMLQRCGVAVDALSCALYDAPETAALKKAGKALSKAIAPGEQLEPGRSYRIKLLLHSSALLPFARGVGFRYSVRKQTRMTAVASCFRAWERAKEDRQLVQTRANAFIRRGMGSEAAVSAAVQEVGRARVLLPGTKTWQQQHSAFHLQSVPVLTARVSLQTFGTELFFSKMRKGKKYTAATRLLAIVQTAEASADVVDLNADDDDDGEEAEPRAASSSQPLLDVIAGTVNTSSAASFFGKRARSEDAQPQSDRVCYAEPKSSSALPVFHVRLVGKRDVGPMQTYDLTVPSPQGVEPAFTANGVVVHNCSRDQIQQEVRGVLDMLESVYGVFGFKYSLALSTRPEKFLGEKDVWDQAEKALEQSLTAFLADKNRQDELKWQQQQLQPAAAVPPSAAEDAEEKKNPADSAAPPAQPAAFTPMQWTYNHGDGAFYGPKIDIQLTDALHRRHQCFSTDTRVLTCSGFLFLDQIEALVSAGNAPRYACYDEATKSIVYRPGALVYPEEDDLLDFTSASERSRWEFDADGYPQQIEAAADARQLSNQLSLRVTPQHRLYVQKGGVAPYAKQVAAEVAGGSGAVQFLAYAEAGIGSSDADAVAVATQLCQTFGLSDEVQVTAWLELYGFWLGNGSLKYADGVCKAVLLSQPNSKPAGRRWLRARLAALPLQYSESVDRDDNVTCQIVSSSWLDFFDAEYRSHYQGSPRPYAPASDAAASPSSLAHKCEEQHAGASSSSKARASASSAAVSPVLGEEGEDEEQRISGAPWLIWWALKRCDRRQLRLILDGLRQADGASAEGGECIDTSSVLLRDQLVVALLHAGFNAHFRLNYREGAVRGFYKPGDSLARVYRPEDVRGSEHLYCAVRAKADSWRVLWSDPARGVDSLGACQPELDIADVQTAPLNGGRIWCVTVDHPDHLVLAQRAHRSSSGVVTKASTPVVVGQCATIQLDFQLPIRFELSYKGEDSSAQRPVIIHRAILGSVERMMAVLIEHTGGKWPFWLSPRQVCVVPVTETLQAYAKQVGQLLHADGLYVDVDDSSATLNKKIREAQLEQYNLIAVVGGKEERDAHRHRQAQGRAHQADADGTGRVQRSLQDPRQGVQVELSQWTKGRRRRRGRRRTTLLSQRCCCRPLSLSQSHSSVLLRAASCR